MTALESAPPQSSPAAALSFSRRWQLARPLLGAYWLALAAGLSLFALARPDADALGRLWLGAVTGSALGNLLALSNLRLWTALLLCALAGPFALLLVGPFSAGPELLSAFVPALICGFVLLGSRSALAAFWFPAMIFSLTLIDRLDGDRPAVGLDARTTVMQVMIALAFLLLLAMYERRRIALWRVVGNVAHVEGNATILREPAGRSAARAGWSSAIVIAAAALTAWIAPRLWHGERLDGDAAAPLAAGAGGTAARPCCPVAARVARARVREYLELASGVEHAAAPAHLDCVACNGAAATAPLAATAGSAVAGEPGPLLAADSMGVAPGAPTSAATEPTLATLATLATGVGTHTSALPIPTTPALASLPPAQMRSPAAAFASSGSPSSMLPSSGDVASPASHSPSLAPASPTPAEPIATAAPGDRDDALLGWIMTLLLAVAGWMLASLLLRPLRRAVTLRHLRRPYWPEPLQQRVSNLWQLALIGLRDAGVRIGGSELPEDVARRAAVAEVSACAAILARARHGLGLDDGDLAAMRMAAEGTFARARKNLGAVARAASWVRWPLL